MRHHRLVSISGIAPALRGGTMAMPTPISVLCAIAALPGCYLVHGPEGEREDEPPAVVPASHAELARGAEHACVLLGDGSVHCWGGNTLGQLGVGAAIGPGAERQTPSRVELPPVRQISASGAVTCALDRDARVHCWGSNAHGQLGIGLNAAPDDCAAPGDCATRPVEVADLHDVLQVSVGGMHACALRADGRVLCWGFIALDLRDTAQAPPPATEGEPIATSDYSIVGTPVLMRGVRTATQIAVGTSSFGPGHTCALLEGGDVQCWGNRTFGQTGPVDSGLDARDPLPPERTGFALDGAAVHVAAGSTHSCAVTARGEVFCWGLNSEQELGAPGQDDPVCDAANTPCPPPGTVRTPLRAEGIAGAVAVSIQAGADAADRQTCALLSDGTVTCWHGGRRAQVPGLNDVVALSGSCASVRDGRVYCWQPQAAPALVAEVALASARQ